MKPIVIVENVSKKFSRNAYEHLSYGVRDLLHELFGRTRHTGLRKDEFLAVNDCSLHLYPGDTLALVGRNGSGKTTLLKMMNGLIKPDAGTIIMDGRIQALIALGSGFNQKLSGRENIYISAALMGLNRGQTREIIDEILDFAELDNFIDSPVGTYSSGMKARLGFSVAIHLRPEILLIDEILAVGDFAFQNKCFIKMQQLKKQGVTIVLVSHSHTAVLQLCEKAVWLHDGRIKQAGPARETVNAYLEFLDQQEAAKIEAMKEKERRRLEKGAQSNQANGKGAAPAKANLQPPKSTGESLYGPIYDDEDQLADVQVNLLVDEHDSDIIPMHRPVTLRYRFRLLRRVDDLNVSLVISREDGQVLTTISTLNGDLLKKVHEGVVECEVHIPDLCLTPGTYVVVMPIHEGKSYLWRNIVKRFLVPAGGRMCWQIIDLPYEYTVRNLPSEVEVSA